MNEEDDALSFTECLKNGQGFYPVANKNCLDGPKSGLIVLDGLVSQDSPSTPVALFYNGHDGTVSQVMNGRHFFYLSKRELIEPRFVLTIKED